MTDFRFELDTGVGHPHTIPKERQLMDELPCPSCGANDWIKGSQMLVRGPADEIGFKCGACGRAITVRFDLNGPGLFDVIRKARPESDP